MIDLGLWIEVTELLIGGKAWYYQITKQELNVCYFGPCNRPFLKVAGIDYLGELPNLEDHEACYRNGWVMIEDETLDCIEVDVKGCLYPIV